MGAEDDVDVPGPLPDLLLVHLGQAPAHGDLHVRPRLPEGLQVAQVAVELVVGVLPDAAGVEHDDVGRLHVGGRHETVRHEGAGQPLGVVLVHLAPEGADVEGPRARLGHGTRIRRPPTLHLPRRHRHTPRRGWPHGAGHPAPTHSPTPSRPVGGPSPVGSSAVAVVVRARPVGPDVLAGRRPGLARGRPRPRAPARAVTLPPSTATSVAWSAWWWRARPCSPPGSPSRATGRTRATARRPGCWPPWRGARPVRPGAPWRPASAWPTCPGARRRCARARCRARSWTRSPRRPSLDPSAEGRLLAGSESEPLHVVKERCQKVRATVGRHDPAATLARIHAQRSLHLVDRRRGGVLLPGRDSAERGAQAAGPAGPGGQPPAPRPAGGTPPLAAIRATRRDSPLPLPVPEPEAALRADAFFLLVTGQAVPDRPPVPPVQSAATPAQRPGRCRHRPTPTRRPDWPTRPTSAVPTTWSPPHPRPPSSCGSTWPPCGGAGPCPVS